MLIGGWVPHLILEWYQEPDPHFRYLGSVHIDLVIGAEVLGDQDSYRPCHSCSWKSARICWIFGLISGMSRLTTPHTIWKSTLS